MAGWAARQTQEELIYQLRSLHRAVAEAVDQLHPTSALPQPTLRDLYDDLAQLHREFPEVELDLKAGVVAVTTEEIELKGVFLGAFKIELHLERLVKLADSSAFVITALDPHSAGSNKEVTHPHVRDSEVCAGDATVPISTALREGRLVDAFLALNSVLHTYNSRSPFVSLDEWDGISCADCDGTFDSEQIYTCNSCDQAFCDDCTRSCDVCEATFCRECLERCPNLENSAAGIAGRLVAVAGGSSYRPLRFRKQSLPAMSRRATKGAKNLAVPTPINPLQEQEINHERHNHTGQHEDGAESITSD